MAEDEAVKKQMEESKARVEESRKQAQERLTKGKPTPTQDELDRAALGEHVVEKEDDGSGPDPGLAMATRNLEADKSGTYQTKQQSASQQRTPPRPTPPRPE